MGQSHALNLMSVYMYTHLPSYLPSRHTNSTNFGQVYILSFIVSFGQCIFGATKIMSPNSGNEFLFTNVSFHFSKLSNLHGAVTPQGCIYPNLKPSYTSTNFVHPSGSESEPNGVG